MLRLAICAALLATPATARMFSGEVERVKDGVLTIHGVEISLWGVIITDTVAATNALRVLNAGETVSCALQGMNGHLVATCATPGNDLSRTLVFIGAATEDCAVTNGAFGRCE